METLLSMSDQKLGGMQLYFCCYECGCEFEKHWVVEDIEECPICNKGNMPFYSDYNSHDGSAKDAAFQALMNEREMRTPGWLAFKAFVDQEDIYRKDNFVLFEHWLSQNGIQQEKPSSILPIGESTMDFWTKHVDLLEKSLLENASTIMLHFLRTATPDSLAALGGSDFSTESSNTKSSIAGALASRLEVARSVSRNHHDNGGSACGVSDRTFDNSTNVCEQCAGLSNKVNTYFLETGVCSKCGELSDVVDPLLVDLYTGLGLSPEFVWRHLPRLRQYPTGKLSMVDIGVKIARHVVFGEGGDHSCQIDQPNRISRAE